MFKRHKDNLLDKEIDRVLGDMAYHKPTSEEYEALLELLAQLRALKDTDNVRKPVSWDALITAGASLLGILLIVAYEQKHVWTSKATGHLLKP